MRDGRARLDLTNADARLRRGGGEEEDAVAAVGGGGASRLHVSRSWRSVFAHSWSSATEAGRNHFMTPAHGPASSWTHRHSSRTAGAIAIAPARARGRRRAAT